MQCLCLKSTETFFISKEVDSYPDVSTTLSKASTLKSALTQIINGRAGSI